MRRFNSIPLVCWFVATAIGHLINGQQGALWAFMGYGLFIVAATTYGRLQRDPTPWGL